MEQFRIHFHEEKWNDLQHRIDSTRCLNKKPKDHANVDSFQKSEAEEFIEGAMLLMNVVGIKIFEDTNTILRDRL